MSSFINIRVTDREGRAHRLQAEDGEPLVNALGNANLVEATCGGACSCATCQIYVDPRWLPALPAMQADERDLIDGLLESRPESRLACQIIVGAALEGIGITVAPEQ